jgi:hypothetical protein
MSDAEYMPEREPDPPSPLPPSEAWLRCVDCDVRINVMGFVQPASPRVRGWGFVFRRDEGQELYGPLCPACVDRLNQ